MLSTEQFRRKNNVGFSMTVLINKNTWFKQDKRNEERYCAEKSVIREF